MYEEKKEGKQRVKKRLPSFVVKKKKQQFKMLLPESET